MITISRGKIKYTKAIVIVHGQSEYHICKYIKSNLRLKIDIDSENKGKNSIQITSLMTRLNNTVYKNMNSFLKKYDDVEYVGKGKKRQLLGFKIFTIMDVDDCTQQQKKDYLSKKMFEGHWAYEYIVPIYNDKDLEEVMKQCDIAIIDKGAYKVIFPINNNKRSNDTEQINKLNEKLAKSKKTNMDLFFQYCIDILN